MRDEIDFMVVGISKCGTTTLFEHLRRHPQIFIPKYKECPFNPGETKKEYMTRHFPKNYEGKIIGAVTPQWQRHYNLFKSWFPNAKVIMMVRDSNYRTASYIRMMNRMERPYDLDEINLTSDYFYWMEKWKQHFRIYAYKVDGLWYDDQRFMQMIYKILGVNSNFKSSSLGRIYNVGYDKPNLITKFCKRLPIRYLIPKSIKRRIWHLLEIKNKIKEIKK